MRLVKNTPIYIYMSEHRPDKLCLNVCVFDRVRIYAYSWLAGISGG